jgi:hypothetical protein
MRLTLFSCHFHKADGLGEVPKHSPQRVGMRPIIVDDENSGLDHGTGHFLTDLPLRSPWWTQRCWGKSTDCKIAANIERGFCPKNRSAAVVPSARMRKKL